nr:hypothetical protein K-LCC10_0408 [Kaumoebavirus]
MSNVRIVDNGGATHQGTFDRSRSLMESVQQFSYTWAVALMIVLAVLTITVAYMVYKSRDSFSNPQDGWFTSGATLRHMVGRSEPAFDGRDYMTASREPQIVSSYNQELSEMQGAGAARLRAEMAADASLTENYSNPAEARFSEKSLESQLRGGL